METKAQAKMDLALIPAHPDCQYKAHSDARPGDFAVAFLFGGTPNFSH